MPFWGPKVTDRERERGYTDAQREEALRLPHNQSPSPWMKVVSDPWPNKPRKKDGTTRTR